MPVEHSGHQLGYGSGGYGRHYGGTANYRLAQLLARQNLNNGTTFGGAGHVIQQALMGMMMNRDMEAEKKAVADETAANEAVARGMTPQQPIGGGEGPPVPGSIDRAAGELAGLRGNPFAGRLAHNLMMQNLGRQEKLADRMDDRDYQTGIRRDDREYQAGRDRENREFQSGQNALTRQHGLDIAQLQIANRPARNVQTVDLADGKYVLNEDGTLGVKLGEVFQRGTPTTTPADRAPIGQALGVPVMTNDPLATLDPKAREAAGREQAKQTERQLADTREAVNAGRGMQQDLGRFGQLLNQKPTGGVYGAPVIGPIARQVGAWLNPNISEMQAIADRITPQMRQPGSGATSDFDARMFQSATVGVGKPVEANRNIIQAADAWQKLQADRLAFMEAYATANGGSLRGADQYWQQYVTANPIFDPKSPDAPKLNAGRQTYQQFFGGGGQQQQQAAPAAAPGAPALPPGFVPVQ